MDWHYRLLIASVGLQALVACHGGTGGAPAHLPRLRLRSSRLNRRASRSTPAHPPPSPSLLPERAPTNGGSTGKQSPAPRRRPIPSRRRLRRDSSVYTVTASNSGGNTTSANAVLRVTGVGILAGQIGGGGFADGDKNTQARFWGPAALTFDSAGNLYVADYNAVRKISTQGMVSTIVGSARQCGEQTGSGSGALLCYPYALAADDAGNIYAADYAGGTVWRIDAAGSMTAYSTSFSCINSLAWLSAKKQLFVGDSCGTAGVIKTLDTSSCGGAGVICQYPGSDRRPVVRCGRERLCGERYHHPAGQCRRHRRVDAGGNPRRARQRRWPRRRGAVRMHQFSLRGGLHWLRRRGGDRDVAIGNLLRRRLLP